MRHGFLSIDTVPEDERPSHEAITQEYMLMPAQQVMHQLMAVIKAHMQQESGTFKVRTRYYMSFHHSAVELIVLTEVSLQKHSNIHVCVQVDRGIVPC